MSSLSYRPISVQPSSLRPSSLPSPLYFNFHRPPSHVLFLSSHHMPIPLQPYFLNFLSDFPTFVVPLILSFLILSSCVTPHIHRICSIVISATSNLFPCAFFNAACLCHVHRCRSYHCPVHLPLDLHVHFSVWYNTPYTLIQFLYPLCTLCVTSEYTCIFSILRQRRYQVCECIHSL